MSMWESWDRKTMVTNISTVVINSGKQCSWEAYSHSDINNPRLLWQICSSWFGGTRDPWCQWCDPGVCKIEQVPRLGGLRQRCFCAVCVVLGCAAAHLLPIVCHLEYEVINLLRILCFARNIPITLFVKFWCNSVYVMLVLNLDHFI